MSDNERSVAGWTPPRSSDQVSGISPSSYTPVVPNSKSQRTAIKGLGTLATAAPCPLVRKTGAKREEYLCSSASSGGEAAAKRNGFIVYPLSARLSRSGLP